MNCCGSASDTILPYGIPYLSYSFFQREEANWFPSSKIPYLRYRMYDRTTHARKRLFDVVPNQMWGKDEGRPFSPGLLAVPACGEFQSFDD